MREKHLNRIDVLLSDAVDQGILPGAVVMVGKGPEVVYETAFGFAEHLHGVRRPMRLDMLFDLASLTKVVATLPSLLLLLDQGHIRLADPVGRFLPEFSGGPKARVTVRHLLTHSSGLPSHREFFKTCVTPHEVLTAVKQEPLEAEPGMRVVYSDLGFILLGEVVHAVTDKTLDQYTHKNIFAPLGMTETQFCPHAGLMERIAATEDVPNRGVKVGVVHDENAEALGGVSGHAGLFAPAQDLVRYLQMWLGVPSAGGISRSSVLSTAVKQLAIKAHTEELGAHRGLGWVRRGDAYDHMGDLWPTTAVGHTGFTGTSLAFDPVSQLWTVMLTNSVHFGRENPPTLRLRPLVHNIVAAAMAD